MQDKCNRSEVVEIVCVHERLRGRTIEKLKAKLSVEDLWNGTKDFRSSKPIRDAIRLWSKNPAKKGDAMILNVHYNKLTAAHELRQVAEGERLDR